MSGHHAASSYSLPPAREVPYGNSEVEESESEDPEDYRAGGYHPVRVGETFKDGRYVVLQKLGWGHFSTVWMCFDIQENRHVAAKVQKSAEHYAEAAYDEIRLLDELKAKDPEGKAHVVRCLDHFTVSGPNGTHVCLVFEVLGKSLLSLIRRSNYSGVSLELTKIIAGHVLEGLQFIHDRCQIIHTDLKPENILFIPTDEDYHRMVREAAAACAALRKLEHAREEHHNRRRSQRSSRRSSEAGAADLNTNSSISNNVGGEVNAYRSSKVSSAAATVSTASGSLSGSKGATKGSRENVVSKKVSAGWSRSHHLGSDVEGSDPHHAHETPGTLLTVTPRQRLSSDFASFEGSYADSDDEDEGFVYSEFYHKNVLDQVKLRFNAYMNTDAMFRKGRVKIVDFGNACWADRHFTDDIQTRQYRSPEVIIGAGYDYSADVWSVACLLFEVATGDFLFDPHSGKDYHRDEDHLALMMELLGPMPRRFCLSGTQSSELYTSTAELRHIHRLNFWSLRDVLREKYLFKPEDADSFASFLQIMLVYEPSKRATAAECLRHPFLHKYFVREEGHDALYSLERTMHDVVLTDVVEENESLV
ncbi:SRSF protein kinase 2 [Porphyridium purpureum]|uniref:non-specific serine/threonine protein kinase n=1 Tax=Porphyridium purpureum TaxID=35688 RepID=A0A5J4Z1E8_PORPP|nr:SRSF protein kinase 2 [Porphyridium purpureum]|eukprot:POR7177..scf208_2